MILENIEKAIAVVGDFSGILGKVFEGGITRSDMKYAFEILGAVKDVFKIDFSKITAEVAKVKDKLDDETSRRLEVIFASHFDLPNDSIEARVEWGFNALLRGIQAIQVILALKGPPKK